MRYEDENPGEFYSLIAALDWSYWILGSLTGALLGTFLPFSFEGVDFALNALFVVLMIDQIRKSRDIFPSLCGILTCLAAIILSRLGFLPEQHILIVALSLGLAVLILVRGVFRKKTDQKKSEILIQEKSETVSAGEENK